MNQVEESIPRIREVRQVSTLQWERLLRDFKGLGFVRENCFSDPRFAVEAMGHHDKSWPAGLAQEKCHGYFTECGGLRLAHSLSAFHASAKKWDSDALIAHPLILSFRPPFTICAESLLKRWRIVEYWLRLNNRSTMVLDCLPKISIQVCPSPDIGDEDEMQNEAGEPLNVALRRFTATLPPSVRIDTVFKAELVVEYEMARRQKKKAGLATAIRLTAFHRPANDDWLNPA